MKLRVKPLNRKDSGSGLAALDRQAMADLDVSSGEFVEVEGREGRVVARVWPGPAEDADRGVVRIDGQLRQAVGARIDDPVDVEPADVEAVCREAATIAVREHVEAEAAGKEPDVESIVLTADHFERALGNVEEGGVDAFDADAGGLLGAADGGSELSFGGAGDDIDIAMDDADGDNDAGAASDAGAAPGARAAPDAGVAPDAGAASDAGVDPDAGTQSGSTRDADENADDGDPDLTR